MIDFWQTFGHERQKNILKSQIALGKIPHAYLFSGPQGLGKKLLALDFAKQILNTEKLENHPDFQLLDLASEEIKVEGMLDFMSKLSFKPFSGLKKVAIINNAENLNQQSSNALLKTLEEPSPSTVIILISGSGKLMPTIVSRCQTFNFSYFSESDLHDFSSSRKINANDQAIELSFGSIGRLMRLTENKEFFEDQQKTIQKFNEICKLPVEEKLLAISEYSDLENNELEQNLDTWLNWQLRELFNSPQNFSKLQVIVDSLAGLKMNKNKKLVLQNLFLRI